MGNFIQISFENPIIFTILLQNSNISNNSQSVRFCVYFRKYLLKDNRIDYIFHSAVYITEAFTQ